MTASQKTAFFSVSRAGKLIQSDKLKPFLTASEMRYCLSKKYPAEPAAARIAAKNALLGLLRVAPAARPRWTGEIEIKKKAGGKPFFKLSSAFKKKFPAVKKVYVSFAHERELAAAWVMIPA